MSPITRKSANNINSPISGLDVSSLSEDLKLVVSLITAHFDNAMREKDEKIERLEASLCTMKEKVVSLENKIDDNSQYERRDTLVISGKSIPTAQPNENCNIIVRNLIKEQTRLILKEEDISIAHRLGRRPDSSQQDRRSIIFKLCRRDLKRDIRDACKQHKPNFFVNEHLTPTRGTIMFVLRKAKQQNPDKIGVARSQEGNVTVLVPADGDAGRSRRVSCNTRASLDQLLREQLNVSSDKFVKNWPNY